MRVELFGLVPNVPIPCSILPSGPLHNLPCTASAPASGTEQDTLAALLGA